VATNQAAGPWQTPWRLLRLVSLALALTLLPALAAAAAPAGRAFRDCSHCPVMVPLPSGTFVMGSGASDPMHDVLEGPQRPVSVGPIAVGRYDVTVGEWAAFVRATRRPTAQGCQWTGKPGPEGEKSSSWKDLGFDQTDLDPVVCVSWNDAQDYAAWLSRKTRKRYRLLSEAEWEYAARAGTTSAYWWGDGPTHEHANYGTEACCGGLVSGPDKWIKTSPGDAFPPNGFGLYDMSGNVLQWVEDCFSPSYAGLPTDGSAFRTPRRIDASGDLADLDGKSTCSFRVVRGGDWGDQGRWIRSASRSFAPPPGPGQDLGAYRSGGVGFRVARSLP
jgi:formylglycine-generating enzyme required for sulfatase activity